MLVGDGSVGGGVAAAAASRRSRVCGCRQSRYNVLAVAAAFMVLFCAYNSLQNYATSLFPGNLGNLSLATLYASVAVTVATAPALVDALGSRVTMAVGAWLYVAYLLSIIRIVPGVVLAMSVVIGFGAAILWVALGVFVTQNSSRRTYGVNIGLFWSIFQLCQVFGNLVSYLAYSHIQSASTLFIAFSVCGAVGASGLFLLRKPVSEEGEGEGESEGESSAAVAPSLAAGDGAASPLQAVRPRMSCGQVAYRVRVGFLAAVSLFPTPRMLLLLPIMFFSGMELSFWTGEFPQMLPTTSLGLVLTFAGCGEVVGGYVMGRLSDTAGRSVSMLVGFVLYVTGLGLTTWMKWVSTLASPPTMPSWQGVAAPFYFAAFCFGLADSAFNTNIYATISQLYGTMEDAVLDARSGKRARGGGGHVPASATTPLLVDGVSSAVAVDGSSVNGDGVAAAAGGEVVDVDAMPVESHTQSVGAFTIFQFIQNCGSAFGFFYEIPFPLHGDSGTYAQIFVQGALLLLGVACFVLLDRTIVRKATASAGKE